MRRMRLDRLLSRFGVSRKEAAELVKAGRAAVNGQTARDPGMVLDLDADAVTLNGAPVRTDAHFHIMLHKPSGVLTATEDGRGQTVLDLLPREWRSVGLGPVGRLDKDTTGLVILTTDGQLAHRLISPRWEQDKRYIARVEGRVGEDEVRRMAEGIPLKDFTCRPARLVVIEAGEDESLCEVVVSEGKYHQVKRMFGALAHPVLALHRQSIAGIALDLALEPGSWRELTEDERARLYAVTELEE
ncbi:MAG: rRNA pseudouridine synthase [Clostridia bacterium]|nr:rRNA pseudouridine synthase [Clostridia bacterium]